MIVAYAADRSLLAVDALLLALARIAFIRPYRSLSERVRRDGCIAALVGGPPLLPIRSSSCSSCGNSPARADLIRPLFLPTVISVPEQFWVLLIEGEIMTPLLVSLYRTFPGLRSR